MKKIERIRETLENWPSLSHLQEREGAGWRLRAVEWEREIDVPQQHDQQAAEKPAEEIPYGLRIAGDCHHLEDNPEEMQVIAYLAELVVQDFSYTRMADELNRRSCPSRDGQPWTAAKVFKLTPRLIEIAPKILSSTEWENPKKQLTRAAWNS